ncbi:hypothetical protein [Candidatus Amoebophilus asiaticus]|nr:hypothetical protein [Candidatus Amoebophilus asiaticus]
MLHRFLKKAGVLYLVTTLAMLQMVCLPESSKEIEKARNGDNKKIELEEKKSNLITNLSSTKAEIEDIKGKGSDDETRNKQITAVCIKFLKEHYMPYIQVEKEYFAHLAKYEENISERKKYKVILECQSADIRRAEILLQKANSYNRLDNNEIYIFVLDLFKKAGI